MIREPAAKARAEHAPRPLLFKVDDYHRLAELGFLTREHRVELIEGVIYEKYPDPDPNFPEDIPGEPRPLRFDVDDYHKLLEIGFLNEDDRVELINGVIFEMAPMVSRHSINIGNLNKVLSKAFDNKAFVNVQCPIRLGTVSEPEPDLALYKLPLSRYLDRLPGPKDTYLIVEVAASTLKLDRTSKLKLYAKAGILEVWILDVDKNCLEVYRDLEDGKYATQITKSKGELITPLAFPDIQIDWSL